MSKRPPRDGAIITVAGMRGSGKTTLLRRLVEPCRRLLVADSEGKWDPDDRSRVVTSPAELHAALEDTNAMDGASPFRIVYRDRQEVLQVAGPGAAYVLRRCTLVLDEEAHFSNPNGMCKYLDAIVGMGREREVNVLGTTREPQEVHDRLFSQADLVYFFHFEPGNGLDRIRRRFPKLADELPTLARFESRLHVGAMGLSEKEVLARLGQEGLEPANAVLERANEGDLKAEAVVLARAAESAKPPLLEPPKKRLVDKGKRRRKGARG